MGGRNKRQLSAGPFLRRVCAPAGANELSEHAAAAVADHGVQLRGGDIRELIGRLRCRDAQSGSTPQYPERIRIDALSRELRVLLEIAGPLVRAIHDTHAVAQIIGNVKDATVLEPLRVLRLPKLIVLSTTNEP